MFKTVKILPFILSACIFTACLAGCAEGSGGAENTSAEAVQEINNGNDAMDMTTAEVVEDMGVGINLGNTMEVSGMYVGSVQAYETGWGSPVITKEAIQGYKDAGFDTLRVPVAWSNLMNARTYEINPEYLARVREIVGWALDSDLYVIMNIHWDGGWFEGFGDDAKRDKCFEKYESIWTQLCAAFGDCGGKLIFESLNEELYWEDVWNRYSKQGDKEKLYSIANDINQKFVDIVRGSGGNNALRHLLIAGIATDIELTCDPLFKMPEDPAGRCAVSIHYYNPTNFTIIDEDVSWSKARTEWGSEADIAEIDKYLDMMKTNFCDKGVPVIIGEYGAVAIKNKTEDVITAYNAEVAKKARERGMCPVLWDIAQCFYDREKAEFRYPDMLEKIMEAK